MLYFLNPYSLEGDLGKAYNDYAELLPNEDDWACFTDGDTAWLISKYGHQINEIINQNPDTGLFTCVTNRVGCLEQCYNKRISPELNILKHKRIALDLFQGHKLQVRELKGIISGHCMIFKKSTWREVGKFDENVGILSVDNLFSQKILNHNKKILLMQGVYLWHYYRLDTGINDKSHLR